jgi:hypothetical protein
MEAHGSFADLPAEEPYEGSQRSAPVTIVG